MNKIVEAGAKRLHKRLNEGQRLWPDGWCEEVGRDVANTMIDAISDEQLATADLLAEGRLGKVTHVSPLRRRWCKRLRTMLKALVEADDA